MGLQCYNIVRVFVVMVYCLVGVTSLRLNFIGRLSCVLLGDLGEHLVVRKCGAVVNVRMVEFLLASLGGVVNDLSSSSIH